MTRSVGRLTLLASLVAFAWLATSAPRAEQAPEALGAAGLWRYVSLGRPTGDEVKLDGLFVFQGNRFAQQALNLGEPSSAQGAQAHAGTFTIENGKIRLWAEVGLIVTPTAAAPVASSPNRPHELAVVRAADRLSLTFGTGTVQKFTRVGPAAGRIVPLANGALALVDGHFILVFENGSRAVAGSGTFTGTGGSLRLVPERWLSARDGKVRYSTAPVEATLDAASLRITGEDPIRLAAPAK